MWVAGCRDPTQNLVNLEVWIRDEIWTKRALRPEESGCLQAQTEVWLGYRPLLLKPKASSAQGCQSQKGSVIAPQNGL